MTPLALITGASSGLGFEFSRLAAKDGYEIVMVARDIERLQQAAEIIRAEHSVTVDIISKDLGKAGAATDLYDDVKRRGRAVELLINNAGFGYLGVFAQQDETYLENMMLTNVVSLTMLARKIVPDMVSQRNGRVLNVSSTAAFEPGPLMSVYHASKAYVLWFSEALAIELEGSGVTVTALCPGPVKTRFQERSHASNTPILRSPLVLDARRVAEIGYRAMMAGKRVVVPGAMNALAAFAAFHSPRSIAARATKSIYLKGS